MPPLPRVGFPFCVCWGWRYRLERFLMFVWGFFCFVFSWQRHLLFFGVHTCNKGTLVLIQLRPWVGWSLLSASLLISLLASAFAPGHVFPGYPNHFCQGFCLQVCLFLHFAIVLSSGLPVSVDRHLVATSNSLLAFVLEKLSSVQFMLKISLNLFDKHHIYLSLIFSCVQVKGHIQMESFSQPLIEMAWAFFWPLEYLSLRSCTCSQSFLLWLLTHLGGPFDTV